MLKSYLIPSSLKLPMQSNVNDKTNFYNIELPRSTARYCIALRQS